MRIYLSEWARGRLTSDGEAGRVYVQAGLDAQRALERADQYEAGYRVRLWLRSVAAGRWLA